LTDWECAPATNDTAPRLNSKAFRRRLKEAAKSRDWPHIPIAPGGEM
jgi:hypothetical protein